MPDPNEKVGKGAADGGGAAEPKVPTPEEFKELSDQVKNLNKGIATYRDSEKAWKSKYDTLEQDFTELKSKIDLASDDDKDEKLAPEDQKKLEAWAKKQGFVSQKDLQAERQKIQQESAKAIENQAISEFLDKHKEYDKDEEWSKVQAEFQLYKAPTSLEGYRKLLNKIHAELNGDDPKNKGDAKAQARVELLRKGRLSLGGGLQSGGNENDATVENYQKRYPNLSRDQIEERLSEIRSLYPKK